MIYKAIQGLPQAHAKIKGSKEYPDIRGNVYLYEVYNGTVLLGELMGIPEELEKKYGGFFGFHIHEGNACTGDSQDPFADTKGHYNPEKEEHPRHAGDLPPVLSNDGTAWMEIYTEDSILWMLSAGRSYFMRCRMTSRPSRPEIRNEDCMR